MFYSGLLVGLLLLAMFVAIRSVVYVVEGEVVVLSRFGRALRDSSGQILWLSAGLHVKQPWDDVLRVSIKEQCIELDSDEDLSVMTNDGIAVRYQCAMRMAPLVDKLEHHLFGLARPTDHVVGTFSCLLRNEIANFSVPAGDGIVGTSGTSNVEQLIDSSVGAYAMIRRERRTLNERVTSCGQRLIGDQFGIRLEAIDVIRFDPPDELRDALNTVMQAKNDVDASLYRAEGDCQQKLLSARKGVAIAIERARAIEVEMSELANKLSELAKSHVLPDYVARRRAEVLSEARQVYVRSSLKTPAAPAASAQKVNP